MLLSQGCILSPAVPVSKMESSPEMNFLSLDVLCIAKIQCLNQPHVLGSPKSKIKLYE